MPTVGAIVKCVRARTNIFYRFNAFFYKLGLSLPLSSLSLCKCVPWLLSINRLVSRYKNCPTKATPTLPLQPAFSQQGWRAGLVVRSYYNPGYKTRRREREGEVEWGSTLSFTLSPFGFNSWIRVLSKYKAKPLQSICAHTSLTYFLSLSLSLSLSILLYSDLSTKGLSKYFLLHTIHTAAQNLIQVALSLSHFPTYTHSLYSFSLSHYFVPLAFFHLSLPCLMTFPAKTIANCFSCSSISSFTWLSLSLSSNRIPFIRWTFSLFVSLSPQTVLFASVVPLSVTNSQSYFLSLSLT